MFWDWLVSVTIVPMECTYEMRNKFLLGLVFHEPILSLDGNEIGPEGAKHFARVLVENKTLQGLK